MNRAQPLQAPVGLLPLPRPLMTGEVLDAAFRLFRASLLRCLPYSGLAVLVLELPTLYDTFLRGDFAGGGQADRYLVFGISLLLGIALFGVLTLRLSAVSRGARPRFRREILTVLRRWPNATLVTVVALGFPILIYSLGTLPNSVIANPLMLLLCLLLLIFSALLAVALPAFWCDNLGPFAAIVQAFRISWRRFWRMVGALLATAVLIMVFYLLAAIAVGLMSPLLGRADLFLLATIRSLLSLVIGAFGVPFVLAMLVVANEDLKLRDDERRGAVR